MALKLNRSAYDHYVEQVFTRSYLHPKERKAYFIDQVDKKLKIKECSESNILKGRILEELVSQCLNDLNKIFKKNPINGIGPDHIINEVKVAIEAKNWNSAHLVSPTKIKVQILPRFNLVIDIYHKLLIISKLNACAKAIKLLKDEGVWIIEIGYQITDLAYQTYRKTKILIFKKLKSFFANLIKLKRNKIYQNLSIQAGAIDNSVGSYSYQDRFFSLLYQEFLHSFNSNAMKKAEKYVEKPKKRRKFSTSIFSSLNLQKTISELNTNSI